MQYFVVLNGQQVGPIEETGLAGLGITPQTLVWREGMTNWVPASSVSELSHLFNNQSSAVPPTPPTAAPAAPNFASSQSYYQPQQQPAANNLPAFSSKVGAAVGAFIISFLVGGLISMIPAIVGWVKASNANSYFQAGDYSRAYSTNSSAGNWITAAYVCSAVIFVLLVIIIAAGS